MATRRGDAAEPEAAILRGAASRPGAGALTTALTAIDRLIGHIGWSPLVTVVMTCEMLFDFANIPARERDKLLLSTVIPRPVAWIVSLGLDGQLNAAPFSFFNAFAVDPPVIGIGIGSHDPARPKDTRRNISETKQFVVNLVSEDMARAMNITAIDFETGVSEISEAGL